MSADISRARPAEPIAIVGMAGRFAGADDLDAFWELLVSGTDAVTEIPPSRYDVDAVYDPVPRTPGKTVSRWGGLLDDIRGFDAEFFGIAPKEAALMDPQQRLLLEVSHEALEDAGQRLEDLAGSDTGVFVGQIGSDYWHLQYRHPESLDLYAMTGAASRAITAGRVSFAYDLRGPSLAVDTACASSLVAVHQAVQAIRLGECGLAIAAGVNLILLPEEGVAYSGVGMLAEDGRCKFGDASGDGFVRSDGVGAVFLKPLARALADGDRIRAVLRGTAVGNDGRSSGFLVTPAVEGQSDVIRRAYADAGIDPADTDYVEAHGTGTPAGDPVELAALAAVLGAGRRPDRPFLVGSVKTNIGHAEAAAGIASLIKTVLSLEHGTVPPSLHLRDPNPEVAWDDLPLAIATEATDLPERGRPAVASISSFGFSGTNAHLVLTAAPERPASAPAPERDELLLLAAADPEALTELAARTAEHLAGTGDSLHDVCFSLATRRSHLESRLAVPVASREQAVDALREFVAGSDAPDLSTSEYTDAASRPRVAFVFPGQGSQWVGMGRELLASEPVFADAIRACSGAIEKEAGWSLLDLLADGTGDWFELTSIVQPTLWAMEIALAALWRSWGVEPDVVIGHSMGEAAAAHVSGALSLADAAAVICRRSKLAERLAGQGIMAWVALSGAEAAAAIAGHERSVAVAACNSPTSTLISGDADAVRSILADLDRRDVVNRVVRVDFASHCPQIDRIADDLRRELKDVAPRAGTIPLHSTLLGEPLSGAELDADYWVRNIREPVDFVGAVGAQLDAEDTVFVEMSPHPLLVNAVKETARAHGAETVSVGSLRRDEPERAALLAGVGALFTAAVPVDYAALFGGGEFVPVPHHPWRRTDFWLPERPAPAGHPLLGVKSAGPDGGLVYTGPIDLRRNAYLLDHRVQETVILPGTAHVEMMLAAARPILGAGPVALADVHFERAVFLDEGEPGGEVRVTAVPAPDGSVRCEIRSRTDEGEWVAHSRGVARRIERPARAAGASWDAIKARCPEHQDRAAFYPTHAARGNQWNGTFQGIADVWRREGEALARLDCPAALRASLAEHEFHPALLDAAGQSIVAARPDVAAGQDQVFVLGSIAEVRVYGRPTTRCHSHALLTRSARDDSFTGEVEIYDEEDNLVGELRGGRLQYLLGASADAASAPESEHARWLYDVEFAPCAAPAPVAGRTGTWVVLTDSGTVGRRVLAALRERGADAVVISAAERFHAGAADRFRIDPDRPADYRAALTEIASRGAIGGVVHLWSADVTVAPDPSGKEIDRAALLACRSAVHLVQALEDLGLPGDPRLWLVTRDAQRALPGDEVTGALQAPLWGLGRTAAAEHRSLRVGLLDLDRDPDSARTAADLLLGDTAEDQLAVRRGHAYTARLVEHRAAAGRGARKVTMPVPGVLDDLTEVPVGPLVPGPDEVVIDVSHAALNYRDVLMAVGMYPGQSLTASPKLGWECAGTVAAVGARVRDVAVGEEVVAIAEGALASRVVAPSVLVAPKPRRITAAEAVTLPAAYITAYYALCDLGGIGAGDKVLVHTATGGVGLAALQIARWKNAVVYGTAGSPEKRRFLDDLGVAGTSTSRSTAFAEDFAGVGFDLILNTLTGPAVDANLSLMAPYGRYLEISKRDILEGNGVSLAHFARNLSFHAVDLVAMMAEVPERPGRVLREVCALVDDGVLDPLPFVQYPASRAAEAFLLMGQARHTGKIVVSFEEPSAAVAAPVFRPDASYLVTGGLGGIGAKVADWLVDHGARRLVLTGRSAADPEHPVLAGLRARGAECAYAAVDVADADAMRDLFARFPDLRGVFHAAGTVDYAPLREIDGADLDALLRPKIRGTLNLDRLAPAGLDHFVLFSSGSALLGSPFLGGYAAGNAFLDALAHRRRARGVPATVVNWGFWGDVGMVARREQEDGRSLVPTGMRSFDADTGLAILAELIAADAPQTAVLPADWAEWAAAYPEAATSRLLSGLVPGTSPAPPRPAATTPRPAAPSPRPAAPTSPPATPPHPAAPTPRPAAQVPRPAAQVPRPAAQVPRPAAPPPVRAAVPVAVPAAVADDVEGVLLDKVAEVLGLKPERINTKRPLNKMGLDSLMAVELRNRVERELGTKLPIVKLLKGGSIASVAEAIRELKAEGAA
ncbi:type I polyketide synthase [Actinomadura rayongensis]|uniref:SDR family NAD(P)-dependent oxidoreductase n=1 Tax=Actinomadura rayongensis TaxID=1429076 RepID=A0A6I4W7T1_9ACTN|nr:type I polyketide synthase [Actinomadura rayongensis]MXQ65531.1 SDR family NAD(P)-dependent oxidoreductase [Actinomadura rayongensis]